MNNDSAAKPGDQASVTVGIAVAPQQAFRIFTDEIDRKRVWEPPQRLVFSWRAANFAQREQTEVEVSFSASALDTTETVVHRGWSDIRADHPARHGLGVPAVIGMMGLWWGDLMTSLRVRAASEGRMMPTHRPPGAA